MRSSTISRMPASTSGTIIEAVPKPTHAFRWITPAPPIAAPTWAPANIKPLARPRSSSGRTEQANPSIATSWLAANTL